jgi:amino acid transporter
MPGERVGKFHGERKDRCDAMSDHILPEATPIAGGPAAVRRDEHPSRLAENALGLPGVLFCIVTGAAPIAAMLFNVPVTVLGGGFASPAAFLVATIVLTIFAVGYIEMARAVSAVGGFYSFVSHGFGPIMGMGTAALISLCYVIFTCAVLGVTGYFASTSINDWFSIDLPAWVYMIVIVVLLSGLAWFHIEVTSKILGVFLVTELIGLLIFGFAILFSGGENGLSLSPLNPAEIFDNSAAVKAFGAGAAGIALFGAFWSWVGFEMAPNYAEESKDPHKIAGIAMYTSVIGLGILYIFISWMFVTGWGNQGAADAVAKQYAGDYASAFYPLTDRYVGSGLTTLFELLIITGSFACCLAFYNTSSRYFFSMGREGILPRSLGRVHPTHRSPYLASMLVTVLVVLYAGAFTLSDTSTLAALLKLGTWSPLLGVLGILAIQALVSFAIIRYFLTTGRGNHHRIKTLLAPLVGGVAQIGACYLLIKYRGDLSGAADNWFIKLIPWLVVAIFLSGIVAALYWRSSQPEKYEAIGRFVHEDA